MSLKQIKTGRKTDKTPCFLLCKTENFIVQFARNFIMTVSGREMQVSSSETGVSPREMLVSAPETQGGIAVIPRKTRVFPKK